MPATFRNSTGGTSSPVCRPDDGRLIAGLSRSRRQPYCQPRVLILPHVKGRLADTQLPADISCLVSGLILPKRRDDLFFRMSSHFSWEGIVLWVLGE